MYYFRYQLSIQSVWNQITNQWKHDWFSLVWVEGKEKKTYTASEKMLSLEA